MTAPVVAELRRRRPDLRLTLQTDIARGFLETRFQPPFDLVGHVPDFGLKMISSTEVDREASARAYRDLHADWAGVVGREAERLSQARPSLVLANVPYVTIAAAAQAGIPVAAFSSLEWAGIYRAYLGDRPEATAILAEMRGAYCQAAVFLRCTPGMAMDFANVRTIGPVARRGVSDPGKLRTRLGIESEEKLGLIAFGGIEDGLPFAQWPSVPGWRWLAPRSVAGRDDLMHYDNSGFSFSDLIASVDLVVSKPGYGTFTEAGLSSTPVLYVARPDWPECPALDDWLAAHTRCRAVSRAALLSPDLGQLIDSVLESPRRPKAEPSGVNEAADILGQMLRT